LIAKTKSFGVSSCRQAKFSGRSSRQKIPLISIEQNRRDAQAGLARGRPFG
jgi:hypothetical protein